MKKWLSLCLAVMLLLTAASCADSPDPFVVSSGVTEQKQKLNYTYCDFINDDSVVIPLTAPDESLYYYNMLKNDQPDLSWIYDEVVYAASHLANPNAEYPNVSEVYFEQSVTQEQLDRVFICVMADHPELWFLRQPSYNGCVLHEGNDRLAYLTYGENIADIPSAHEEILAAADKILDEATDGLTLEADIISALCGYLCENNKMGDDAFSQRPNLSMREVFLEKEGSCLAHVMGLNFLLQRSDIAAVTGVGCLGQNEYLSHFWTITIKDGVYFYTDVYYMGQVYNGTEEAIGQYMMCDNMDMMNRREVSPAAGVPLPGTKVGSGEVADGVILGSDAILPIGTT